MNPMNFDAAWWIAAFDIPATSGLLWFIWRVKTDCDAALGRIKDSLERRSDQLREALSSFKLEVAKTYASQTDMRDLESRLVAHLLRIESKLDATALKAEALNAKTKN